MAAKNPCFSNSVLVKNLCQGSWFSNTSKVLPVQLVSLVSTDHRTPSSGANVGLAAGLLVVWTDYSHCSCHFPLVIAQHGSLNLNYVPRTAVFMLEVCAWQILHLIIFRGFWGGFVCVCVCVCLCCFWDFQSFGFRLSENWPDPDSFRPERFLRDYDPYSFLPFSAGPFMCIGNSFALTEMKVVLARLLASFRFQLLPGYTYRRIRQLTMQPSPPLSLLVSSSSPASSAWCPYKFHTHSGFQGCEPVRLVSRHRFDLLLKKEWLLG